MQRREPSDWYTLAGVFATAGVAVVMSAWIASAGATRLTASDKGLTVTVISGTNAYVPVIGVIVGIVLIGLGIRFYVKGHKLQEAIRRLSGLRKLEVEGLVLDERAQAIVYAASDIEAQTSVWKDYKAWRHDAEAELSGNWPGWISAFQHGGGYSGEVEDGPAGQRWNDHHKKEISASAQIFHRIAEYIRETEL